MSTAFTSDLIADRLRDLGDIPQERIRTKPPMGTATIDDLITVNERKSRTLCELVDQTIVEKAMGYEASVVAAALIRILSNFIVPRQLGLVSGPDGFFRLPAGDARGPDVAFVARERLQSGGFPTEAYPAISPDLAVEVLSPGNTAAEMSRKRIEYFNSGVRLVWIVDCHLRTVRVYTSPSAFVVFDEASTIDGGEVLAEFKNPVAEFFAELDVDWRQ